MKLKQELADYLDIHDILQYCNNNLLDFRMWITYNRAPYDNGHPIGEEIQVYFQIMGQ